MSKRKDAIALFDLINKGRTEQTGPGLNVPGWFNKRPPPVPPGAEAPQPPAEGAAGEGTAPPAGPPAPRPPGAFAPRTPAEPMVSAGEGRVRFSLNYVACAVCILGLITLLLGVFLLGRVTARPSAATPSLAPGRGVAPGGGQTPATGPAAPERIKGKYYLIIDRMAGTTDKDWDDAEAIVEYCRSHGHPCTIVKWGTQYFAVWSLEPFGSPDSKEALDFAKTIEDLGRNYRPAPPRTKYTFSQHSGTKLSPSYVRQKD